MMSYQLQVGQFERTKGCSLRCCHEKIESRRWWMAPSIQREHFLGCFDRRVKRPNLRLGCVCTRKTLPTQTHARCKDVNVVEDHSRFRAAGCCWHLFVRLWHLLGINFAESSWLNYARAPLELLLGLGCQAELLESPGGKLVAMFRNCDSRDTKLTKLWTCS